MSNIEDKKLEEDIKRICGTINSKCPVCNNLLNTNTKTFKSNDVGFHIDCVKDKDKEYIEDLIDEVLDNIYGVKAELIMSGERDTVLTRYNYGDEIIYRVEFWNESKTGFAFATEFDNFEDAYNKFKSMQHKED